MTDARTTLSQRFADALHDLERTRDVERMVSLFAPDAELYRAPQSHTFRGDAGARELWREYLSFFSEIATEFTDAHDLPGRSGDLGARAVLEWRSRGRLRTSGVAVEYEGVSIVEEDGHGRVARFRTYYEASHLVGDAAKPRARGGMDANGKRTSSS